MNVSVVSAVPVLMGMDLAVGVKVPMGVWLVFIGAAETPDGVGQSESDQRPGGQVASDGLYPFEPVQSNP